MRFLETNIVIRYLTGGDPAKLLACRDLFLRLARGEEVAVTCEAVITEVVYVLSARAHYGLSPAEIRARLVPVIQLKGLRVAHKALYLRALDLYVQYPFLDFEDAVIVAHMEREGIDEVYSYDTDFDRIPTIQRTEPMARSSP